METNETNGRHEAIEAELDAADGAPETPEGPAPSTQEANPRQTMNRTGVQAFIGAAIGLLGLVPLILDIVLETMGEQLPPSVFLWLTGALAVSTGVSVTASRIMAVPGVNEWLRANAPWFAPERSEAGR